MKQFKENEEIVDSDDEINEEEINQENSDDQQEEDNDDANELMNQQEEDIDEMNDDEKESSLNSEMKNSIEIKLKNLNSTIYLIGVCYFQVLQGSIKILGKNIKNSSNSYLLNSNCMYGMIAIENTNQESLIKFYIPNKESEEYDLYTRCYYLHKNLQIFNNLKLEKSKRKLESLYIYGNSNIPTHLIKFDFANDFMKRVINRCTRKELRKYVICGHALSGKSLFSNYLMNELLNYYPKVAFLNLNINVPTFGIRGTLSLSIHSNPTFGPLFQNTKNELIYQIYHGHSTTDIQIETYLKQSLELYQIYCKKYSNIPLIINSQSLLPSSGYQIILELLQILNQNTKNGMTDLIVLSNYKNINLNPSPSGLIDYNNIKNNTIFFNNINNREITGENTSIVDLRNLETLFIIGSKQGYRNHYFSKINLQHLFYFSYCYEIEEFKRIFDLVFTKSLQQTIAFNISKNSNISNSSNSSSNNNSTTTIATTMGNSKSIYEFFAELPTIKLKWNQVIITLLNTDSSELSKGLYYLNGSFVGVYSFKPPKNNNGIITNEYHNKLISNQSSEYPLMTIKTNQELKTQLKCIGLVKKVCPYEKVIYLSIPNNYEHDEIHHLTVGSCVFDFNPEDYCKQTMNQPYFQSKSMTVDKGDVLQNAHKLKLQKQMQQHYKN
ncbi:predicted protein [Naegleria gruberi]|uniref:Predicted protein n=1 Tax=Naegleria gruberi TaxID=5762 RepID=D2VWK6_NAEGR|nr:uncharacterized protein NAEGRDRAFT_73413 [Naegleria gruberi]EFC38908.1 predicted protein [Naegleria gruberi]|eukprot:XP_002671652.1 predicted protein [Naegleria gruberi strain NEG-M]